MSALQLIDYIRDKKILILGFGREGKSTYNFIRKYLPDFELFSLFATRKGQFFTSDAISCGNHKYRGRWHWRCAPDIQRRQVSALRSGWI